MIDVIEANWLAFALALIIGLLVAWWLFGRASTAPRRDYKPDVLDEGAAPAQRNQALIDAAPAAAIITPPIIIPAPMSGAMGGIGELIAVGAQDVVEEAAAAAPASSSDDLALIKGVGPKLVALLGSLGVRHFAQIAAWTEADIAEVDAKLGTFAGRIERDSWVEQCKLLAAGDTAGFEGKFGKL
jgi:predicted flap endonuclease-1-like 5' DNA nuclease